MREQARRKRSKFAGVVRISQDGGNADVAKVGQVLGSYGVDVVGVMKGHDQDVRPRVRMRRAGRSDRRRYGKVDGHEGSRLTRAPRQSNGVT